MGDQTDSGDSHQAATWHTTHSARESGKYGRPLRLLSILSLPGGVPAWRAAELPGETKLPLQAGLALTLDIVPQLGLLTA